MELSRVILGPLTTEKTELQKTMRVYSVRVDKAATKVDIKNALEAFYDVEVTSVRIQRTGSKKRQLGAGRVIVKRHPMKKALITLSQKSKALDLTKFKS